MPVTTAKSNIGAELKHLVQDLGSLNAAKNNPLIQAASGAAQIGLEAAQLEARQQSMALLGTCLQELQNLIGGDQNPGQIPSNNAAAPPSTPAPATPQAASAPAPAPDPNAMPSANDKRPAGDTRSADDIVNQNPTLKNLGNQSGVKDNLKKQVGDWEDPKLSPEQRADAAYRASQVVNYIKSSKASDGSDRSQDVLNNGKIEGFTKDGDARHGTEAGLLQDFGKNGYSALQAEHRLDTTDDTHVNKDGTNVNKDGTNKDNFQWGMEQVGKVITKGISAFEHAMSQVASFVAALHIPVISQIAQAGEVTTEAVADGMDVAHTALEGGDVKKAAEQAGEDLGETAIGAAIDLPGAKQAAKGIIDVAKNAGKEAGKEGAGQVASQYSPIKV